MTGPGFGLSGAGRDRQEMFISSVSEVTTDAKTWCGEGWSDRQSVYFIFERYLHVLIFFFEMYQEKTQKYIFLQQVSPTETTL